MLLFLNGWLAYHLPYHPWSEYILWHLQITFDITLLGAFVIVLLILGSLLLTLVALFRGAASACLRKVSAQRDTRHY